MLTEGSCLQSQVDCVSSLHVGGINLCTNDLLSRDVIGCEDLFKGAMCVILRK